MSEDRNLIGDDPADAVPAEPKERRSRKPKDSDAGEQTQGTAKAAADPYDPDRYTESVDFTKLAATKPFISQLPVRKPAPDDFIRTHETITFANVPLCSPSAEKGQLYLLDSSNEELFADMQKYTRSYFLYYTVTAEGKLSLWPIVGPHPDTGKWHDSPRTAAIAAERAKTEWVQVSHVDGLGYVAVGPRSGSCTKIPGFVEFSRRRLLELAFRPYTISDYDHPYVRRCLDAG
jgi:hypothetical protein